MHLREVWRRCTRDNVDADESHFVILKWGGKRGSDRSEQRG